MLHENIIPAITVPLEDYLANPSTKRRQKKNMKKYKNKLQKLAL